MRRWNFYRRKSAQPFRVALPQLSFQVPPFVKQLAARFLDSPAGSPTPDFPSIKFVFAFHGFVVDGFQVGRQSRRWIFRFRKAEKLRMMFVTARRAAKNLLRQQRLAPERDQSARVEIFRVERPESHGKINPANRAIGVAPGKGQGGSTENTPSAVSVSARRSATCAILPPSRGGSA